MNPEDTKTNDTLGDEILEEAPEEIKFVDNRRFTDEGERVKVDVKEGNERPQPEKVKPPEVLKLEKALNEMSMRCDAAEGKLVNVQKRFEEERAKMEDETASMRDRLKRSLEQRAEQGRFEFLLTLLPLLDNLNLAIEASEKDASFDHLLEGVKGTSRSFRQALVNVGVEAVSTVGEDFDPEVHEAVELVETDPENDGKVTAEYSAGYTYHGKLLRAARVQVGRAAEADSAAE